VDNTPSLVRKVTQLQSNTKNNVLIPSIFSPLHFANTRNLISSTKDFVFVEVDFEKNGSLVCGKHSINFIVTICNLIDDGNFNSRHVSVSFSELKRLRTNLVSRFPQSIIPPLSDDKSINRHKVWLQYVLNSPLFRSDPDIIKYLEVQLTSKILYTPLSLPLFIAVYRCFVYRLTTTLKGSLKDVDLSELAKCLSCIGR
jgi:hypothetical protein